MSLATLGILFSVLITSTLSGVLGMGGGMLLMGILAALLPIGPAMILHGASQLMANGSRAALHARHITWSVLPFYGIGTALATLGFACFAFVPQIWMIYLLMGCLPWFAVFGRRWMVLQIEKPHHAVACGFLVTLLQLACGVSGPALDIFYLHSRLGRHSIVSTKAVTQTLGHAIKLVYYGHVLANGDGLQLGWEWLLGVSLLAWVGTILGGRFLEQTDDQTFRVWSRKVLLVIGTIYLYQGGQGLWQQIAAK